MKLSIRPNYFLLIGLVSVVLSAIVYYLLPASSQKSEELVFQPIEYEIRTSTDFSATRDSVLHDLEIEKKLNAAVDQYLANTPFERPSVTVLYKEENRWLEGSVNPNKLWYPGCLV